MAQSKKNSTTSKNNSKSKTNSKKNSKPVNTAPPEEPVVPIRRELCAAVFLLVAVILGFQIGRASCRERV